MNTEEEINSSRYVVTEKELKKIRIATVLAFIFIVLPITLDLNGFPISISSGIVAYLLLSIERRPILQMATQKASDTTLE